jgi:hypothetical protein
MFMSYAETLMGLRGFSEEVRQVARHHLRRQRFQAGVG